MIDVLYEDDFLIFVNKPADLIVQRAHDPGEPVLYEIVARHTSPLFLMQRLDRGTSGVMFFSKRAEINANLTRQFEQKRIRKTYLAICEGVLAEKQTIDAPLKRIGPISFGVREGGKRAVTRVEPVGSGSAAGVGGATLGGGTLDGATLDASTLLRIELETGRTHQIRVHLSAIGHPLAGDWLYGMRNASRPMLHAAELDMVHPATNTPLRVSAAPPGDFREEAERRGIVIPRGQNDIVRVQLNY